MTEGLSKTQLITYLEKNKLIKTLDGVYFLTDKLSSHIPHILLADLYTATSEPLSWLKQACKVLESRRSRDCNEPLPLIVSLLASEITKGC